MKMISVALAPTKTFAPLSNSSASKVRVAGASKKHTANMQEIANTNKFQPWQY